jgi:hypothetical protein
MSEHCAPEANPNTFDGDAISRADREFLASLGDHPLVRNPLYGAPCPPQPDLDRLRPEEDKEAVQEAVFATVVDWMLVNYAYREGASSARAAPSRWSTAKSSPWRTCAGVWRPGR